MQPRVGFTNFLPVLLVVCSGSAPLNESIYNTTNVNFGSFSINSSILPSSLTNSKQDATSTTKLPVTRLFGSANVPIGQPATITQTNVLTNIRSIPPATNWDEMNPKLENKTTPLLARTKLVRKLLEPLTWGKVVAPIQDGPVKVISKVSSDICPFFGLYPGGFGDCNLRYHWAWAPWTVAVHQVCWSLLVRLFPFWFWNWEDQLFNQHPAFQTLKYLDTTCTWAGMIHVLLGILNFTKTSQRSSFLGTRWCRLIQS